MSVHFTWSFFAEPTKFQSVVFAVRTVSTAQDVNFIFPQNQILMTPQTLRIFAQ